jgi:hypothetical protein
MKNRSRYFVFWAGLLFTISMSVFLLYANHPDNILVKRFELKKSSDLKLILLSEKNKKVKEPIDSITAIRPAAIVTDTISSYKILLIGDSQVEGLMIPFYDYCLNNNHTLLLAAVWSSSTDKLFASNDTLKNMIEKHKPDYIVMVLGLNEMSAKSLGKNELAIKKILSTFNGTPYAWIGPANYMPDKGINNLYQEAVDEGCFFLTKGLFLPRSKDGRHPNQQGNKIWMDSIASWMHHKAHWPLKMYAPASDIKKRNINTWRKVAQWTQEFNGF